MSETDEKNENLSAEEGKENRQTSLLSLFFMMFKIGALTFGGGYAMIPIIKKQFVDDNRFLTEGQMLDIIAAAESLPGALSINTSIITGFRVRRIPGGIIAAAGVVLPSVITITLITYFYNWLPPDSFVWHFMNGAKAGVIALMAVAIVSLFKSAVKTTFDYIIYFGAFLAVLLLKVHIVIIIIISGLIGFFYNKFRRKQC